MNVVSGLGVERVSQFQRDEFTVDTWDSGGGFHAFFLRSYGL